VQQPKSGKLTKETSLASGRLTPPRPQCGCAEMQRPAAGSKLRFSVAHATGEVR